MKVAVEEIRGNGEQAKVSLRRASRLDCSPERVRFCTPGCAHATSGQAAVPPIPGAKFERALAHFTRDPV